MKKIKSREEFHEECSLVMLTEPTILFFTSSLNKPIRGNRTMIKLMKRLAKEYPCINIFHMHDLREIECLYSIEHWPSLDFFKNGNFIYVIRGVVSHMELAARIEVLYKEVIEQ